MKEIINKKILIIGGAGFIGSNLASKLALNNDVVILDNLLSGKIENLPDNTEFYNLSSINILEIDFKKIFDFVFHFGEYARVEQSIDEYKLCFENTVSGIGNVLEFCRINSSKLIYSGSSTKFSKNGVNLSPYTFFKAQNASTVEYMCKLLSIPFAIVYFSNVYGRNEIEAGDYSTVVAKFLLAKKKNERVFITEPGTQTRAFTHINDTISAILLTALFGLGDGYVIGSSKQHSIIELCKLMDLDYDFKEANEANRMTSTINNSKIMALGWKELHSLEVYLDEEILKH